MIKGTRPSLLPLLLPEYEERPVACLCLLFVVVRDEKPLTLDASNSHGKKAVQRSPDRSPMLIIPVPYTPQAVLPQSTTASLDEKELLYIVSER
jgi:hypothetical protein